MRQAPDPFDQRRQLFALEVGELVIGGALYHQPFIANEKAPFITSTGPFVPHTLTQIARTVTNQASNWVGV
jgi:hypothetical protein